MAITEAAKEGIWLKHLVGQMGISVKDLEIHTDSQAALQLAHNPVYHCRTKHIDVKWNKIRELIESKELVLQKISTDLNPADVLTKALSKDKHERALVLLKLD